MSASNPGRTFGRVAEAYARTRPEYPRAAVAFAAEQLGLGEDATVLDLAAGTGKLTRLLVPSGANVIAVEPVREMRHQLERQVPGVAVLSGRAERIPLTERFVDAVTVGTAFHWFEPEAALREIDRVLTPDGGVALIWNTRDERSELHRALTEIIDPLGGDAPRRRHRNWKTLLAESGVFTRTKRVLFEHVQRVDEQAVVDRVLSISFIASADREVRDEVERKVRAVAKGATELPYMTELYLGFKR